LTVDDLDISATLSELLKHLTKFTLFRRCFSVVYIKFAFATALCIYCTC